MELGERIYQFRTAKNMSQGDLADALDVSRQSVSKWENNAAVPELDKLVKMAQLFDVSLDTLVSGISGKESVAAPCEEPKAAQSSVPAPGRAATVPGILLIGFGILLWLIVSPFLALPLLACGILCLFLKRRHGLWCCWVLLVFGVLWMNMGTGITLQAFWDFLSALPLTGISGIYSLLVCLVENILTVLLCLWTVRSYLPAAIRYVHNHRPRLMIGWCLTVVPYIARAALGALRHLPGENYGLISRLIGIGVSILGFVHLAALLTMLILTMAKVRSGDKH